MMSSGHLKRWLIGSVVAAVATWALMGSIRGLPKMFSGLPFAWDYLSKMWPPDFGVLPGLAAPLAETLQSAILGVSVAAAISIPLSFLVAHNTTPGATVYTIGRGIINLCRGLPTLLWAILFVSMVGLGPLAGVFAIICHCIGTFGKTFSEAIEATGPRVVNVLEAMRLDGAAEKEVILYGLLPEVAPLLASYIIYYFEWAVRVGTILGLVGAGGIGLELTMAIRSFRRQETSAIIIVILALVTVIDQCSRHIRRGLLEI